MLQTCQVGAQLRLTVQVDVKGADVKVLEIEKLCRREIDVGVETVGCHVLDVGVKFPQKALDTVGSMPPHNSSRNLVSDRKH